MSETIMTVNTPRYKLPKAIVAVVAAATITAAVMVGMSGGPKSIVTDYDVMPAQMAVG
jgi:hypothetical protein